MSYFEYMEQEGQMTIFDLMDQYEEIQIRKSSTAVSKAVDKKKLKGPRIRGYIVRR